MQMDQLPTPRPTIACRAAIVKDGQILLVNGDGTGDFWCLPGGRMEYGETLIDCVRREAYEETGLSISAYNVFAVSEFLYPSNTFHNVDIFFRCQIESGDLVDEWVDTGGPVSQRRFFTLTELQDLNVFPRFLRKGEWLSLPETDSIYFGQDVKE
jgi:ADP-ribose pyrophosphatase YjhB (NUDIX family)